ncbi:hypothetical protein ACRQU7_01580 [Caproiciproducens sp. R1]|uniref:hypothetical protein n=1 Tax=Caproiciproducens sp. R1 TaxID=3435000 RepID=UPI004033DE86
MKKMKVQVHSIGILGVISSVLAALKLAGLAHCSWLMVIAPLFLGCAIDVVIILLVLLWIKWNDWRERRR